MLNFTTFEKDKRKEILNELKHIDHITYIESLSHRADLLVEFTVPNLSFFNKLEMELLQKFRKEIKLVEVYPIVVKHKFPPKYLSKRTKEYTHKILSGDRVYAETSKNDKLLLKHLIKSPEATILELSKKTKLNIRTVIAIVVVTALPLPSQAFNLFVGFFDYDVMKFKVFCLAGVIIKFTILTIMFIKF